MGKKFEYLNKKDIRMPDKYIKRCSTSFIIREIQVKATMKYHHILISMAKLKNLLCKDVETLEFSYTAMGNIKMI